MIEYLDPLMHDKKDIYKGLFLYTIETDGMVEMSGVSGSMKILAVSQWIWMSCTLLFRPFTLSRFPH